MVLELVQKKKQVNDLTSNHGAYIHSRKLVLFSGLGHLIKL